MNKIKCILKNPQNKKKLYKLIFYNIVTLILLLFIIFDVGLRNIKVDENNTYEITGVVSNIYKPYHIPNSTPIIIMTIGSKEYNLLVCNAYRVADLLNEIKVGIKVTAKITEFKTMMPINRLLGERIIVDLRNSEKIYYDIDVDNKYRKFDLIGISLFFSVLWVVLFVLSLLYIRFIL